MERYDLKKDLTTYPCPSCGQGARVEPSKTHNRPLVAGRRRLRRCECGCKFITYQPTRGDEKFMHLIIPAEVVAQRRALYERIRHELEKVGAPNKYFVALARAQRPVGINNTVPGTAKIL